MSNPSLAVVEILRLRPGSLVVIALDCRSFSSMWLPWHAWLAECMLHGNCLAVLHMYIYVPGHRLKDRTRSRWSSGRSLIRLWGYKDREFVASGNKLSSRVALLIYLCQWRNIRWLLEQPDGSMLPHLPRFQQLWQKYDVLGLFSYFTVDQM